MFNIGGGELLVIAILALLVLGPDKLPQAAKQAGKFMSEARKMSAGFRQELKSAIDEADSTNAGASTPAAKARAAADTASKEDDIIEARARERGHQLTSAPEGAEPIDDQPVKAEPVPPPQGANANGRNGANGNGSASGPAVQSGDSPPETPDPS